MRSEEGLGIHPHRYHWLRQLPATVRRGRSLALLSPSLCDRLDSLRGCHALGPLDEEGLGKPTQHHPRSPSLGRLRRLLQRPPEPVPFYMVPNIWFRNVGSGSVGEIFRHAESR